jgi:hypothetical protein
VSRIAEYDTPQNSAALSISGRPAFGACCDKKLRNRCNRQEPRFHLAELSCRPDHRNKSDAAIVDCRSKLSHHRPMNDHERGFLEFLAEPTKRRMRTFLELGDKRRSDARALLDHAVRLDTRFCRHVAGNEAFPGPVEAMLRTRGAPETCYVMAANSDLDGREMSLSDALEAILGMGNGAFVSCIPGRLGFYEYEAANSSYLLSK